MRQLRGTPGRGRPRHTFAEHIVLRAIPGYLIWNKTSRRAPGQRMFERYTEGARRAIFFARYEASQFGSAYIEAEHLLLGLVREDKALTRHFLQGVSYETVHQEVAECLPQGASIPSTVDLPLSKELKWVLEHAAEEAARLAHSQVGTEHLLLGLLREPETHAAQVVYKHGARLAELRLELAKQSGRPWLAPGTHQVPARKAGPANRDAVEIHGASWNADYIRSAIEKCREHSWHWHKQPWKKRAIVVDRQNASFSFDLRLADDAGHFELVPDGWKADHCLICDWELSESEDDAHNTGYTNGRDWLCTECFEKFLDRPGFFSSPYSEIT
jgi:Clp amino terminal domain, pathogenicity island component